MDLLDDVLKNAGLRTRVLGHRSFYEPMSLQFPCSKSIGFHVVTQGSAFLHSGDGTKPIEIRKGDVALMARGCDHIVSTEPKLSKKLTTIRDFTLLQGASDGKQGAQARLTLVSGAYQLWNDPVHPFFSEIPEWFIVPADDLGGFGPLQSTLQLLADETLRPKIGSERVIHGLLDVMFSLIIRQVVEKSSGTPKSWSHALQDLQIKKALELLHSDCARAWTLEELAQEVGLSRAGFALKFKKAMGDTPLHYLMTVRIQKSMELLSATDLNIEAIALEVGYQDPFGFSKAFKKLTGLPPREFRIKDQEDRKLSWRY